MRWDGLFDDIEARWAELGWQASLAEAAELTRAEWSRVSLADRLRGAVGADMRLHLVWGESLAMRVGTSGRSWIGGRLACAGSVVVPLDAVAAVEGDLGAARPAPEGAVGESSLAAVLRRIARLRHPVRITGMRGDVLVEGTVDRVGEDHLDIARHAGDEARRRAVVRGRVVVPFGAIGLVRSAGRID